MEFKNERHQQMIKAKSSPKLGRTLFGKSSTRDSTPDRMDRAAPIENMTTKTATIPETKKISRSQAKTRRAKINSDFGKTFCLATGTGTCAESVLAVSASTINFACLVFSFSCISLLSVHCCSAVECSGCRETVHDGHLGAKIKMPPLVVVIGEAYVEHCVKQESSVLSGFLCA